MTAQLELFDTHARFASIEQTMIDLGLDTARALEERIAENMALRARVGSLEAICMDSMRIASDHGDRLRMLEIRVGIRPKPAVPPYALSRKVA